MRNAYPAEAASKLILDAVPSVQSHYRHLHPYYELLRPCAQQSSTHVSKETWAWLDAQPESRFSLVFTLKHGSWFYLVEVFFSKMARSVLHHVRDSSKAELKYRILAYLDDVNGERAIHTWTYNRRRSAIGVGS